MSLKYILIIIIFSLINFAQTSLTISGNVSDTLDSPLQAEITINQLVRGEWEFRGTGTSSPNGEFSITVNNITSVNPFFNYSLQFYSLNENTFRSPTSTHAEVIIYNIIGEIVLRKSLQLSPGYNELPLKINSFANGIYIRVIKLREGMITQKIVKNGSSLNFGIGGINRVETFSQRAELNKNPDDSLYIMTIAESEGFLADTIVTTISTDNLDKISDVSHRLIEITAKYFYPGNIGTFYTYEGTSTDTNNVSTAYQRDAEYISTEVRDGQQYILQSNSISIADSVSSGDFLFRVSDNSMFIYIDSGIFDEILASLGIDPGLVTINAYQEVRLFNYPFQDTPSWSAFFAQASVLGGLVTLDILELDGFYKGEEQIEFMGNLVTAKKVEYIATLRIPESLNDIANPPVETVTAHAWYLRDVGIIKTEGSELILGVFGGVLDFNIDGTTVSEFLIDYEIK